jgi:hypothetical protein
VSSGLDTHNFVHRKGDNGAPLAFKLHPRGANGAVARFAFDSHHTAAALRGIERLIAVLPSPPFESCAANWPLNRSPLLSPLVYRPFTKGFRQEQGFRWSEN